LAQIEVLQIVHAKKISDAFVNNLKLVQDQKEHAIDATKPVAMALLLGFNTSPQGVLCLHQRLR